MIVSAGVYQYIYMYREKSLLLQEQVIDIWYRLTTLISKVHRLVWSSLCCYFWNIWLNIRTIFWIIENNDFSQESARHFVSSLWAVSVFFCLFGFIVSYIMAHSCEQILEIKQKRLIANNVRLDSSTWNTIKRNVPSQPSNCRLNINKLTKILKHDNRNELNRSNSLMDFLYIGNMTCEIVHYVKDYDVDDVALTEIWLKSD